VEEKQKQLLLSLQFVKPPQTCALHCEDVHEPFSHVPDGHTFPHEPQLFGSVRVLVQVEVGEDDVEDRVDEVLDGAADEDELKDKDEVLNAAVEVDEGKLELFDEVGAELALVGAEEFVYGAEDEEGSDELLDEVGARPVPDEERATVVELRTDPLVEVVGEEELLKSEDEEARVSVAVLLVKLAGTVVKVLVEAAFAPAVRHAQALEYLASFEQALA
jgi:hypothetical protein